MAQMNWRDNRGGRISHIEMAALRFAMLIDFTKSKLDILMTT
jgi:hypothetical protein